MKTLQMNDPLPLVLGSVVRAAPTVLTETEPGYSPAVVRWVLDSENRQNTGDLVGWSGMADVLEDDAGETFATIAERCATITAKELERTMVGYGVDLAKSGTDMTVFAEIANAKTAYARRWLYGDFDPVAETGAPDVPAAVPRSYTINGVPGYTAKQFEDWSRGFAL